MYTKSTIIIYNIMSKENKINCFLVDFSSIQCTLYLLADKPSDDSCMLKSLFPHIRVYQSNCVFQ